MFRATRLLERPAWAQSLAAKAARVVAFDTETALAGPARQAPQFVCLTWSERRAGGIKRGGFGSDPEGLRAVHAWLRGLLADDSVLLGGHNIAYDFGVICEQFPDLLPLVFRAYDRDRVLCTMVGSKLWHIARGDTGDHLRYSLAEGLKERCHIEMDPETKAGEDIVRKRYSEQLGKPFDEYPHNFRDYALDDARFTLMLLEKQLAKPLPDFRQRSRIAWWLHLTRCHGIRTDPVFVEALSYRLHAAVDDVLEQMKEHGILRRAGWGCPHCGLFQRADGVGGVEVEDFKAPCAARTDEEGPDKKGRPRKHRRLKVTTPGSRNTAEVERRLIEAFGEAKVPKTDGTFHDDGTPKSPPKVKMDETTLMMSGDPVLQAYGRTLKRQKLLHTFVPVLRGGAHGPIHPWWNVLVDTGRTSCRSPNLQNISKFPGVRDCFVPRPGHVFVQADYTAAEMCSLGQVLLDLYGESPLLDVINAGRDLHIETAALLLGIEYGEAEARYKAEKARGEKRGQLTVLRQLAKVYNFGLPGGMGIAKFYAHAQAEMAEDDCTVCWGTGRLAKEKTCACTGVAEFFNEEFVRKRVGAWKRKYGLKPYFNDISKDLRAAKGGRMRVRQFVSGRIRGNVGYSDGANGFFQGRTADGACNAGWLIAWECYVDTTSPLYGSRIVLFVHDEFILETPVEKAQAAAARLSQLMVEGMDEVVPDATNSAPAALMERWYKGADPVHDEEGQLIPWRPKTPTFTPEELEAARARLAA